MKRLSIAFALAGLLTMGAGDEQPSCKARNAGKDMPAACKQVPSKTQGYEPGSGLTEAHKERLDRAYARSLLESIDSQVRRQRLGN